MASGNLWQRSDLLGTQVITRSSGKSLGVVSDLWVDVDRREVVALALRANMVSRFLPGITQYMLLSSICQVGDVILVEDETALTEFDAEPYSRLVNAEVISENGELLGRVRGLKFDIETGKVTAIVLASLGLPLIPEQVLSTYELAIEEVVSTGPNRLIVFEGAETRLIQLSVGVLERLGIGAPPWEQGEDEAYFTPTAPIENQLGTGEPVPVKERPQPTAAPVEEVWEADDWGAPEPLERPTAPNPTQYYEEELEADNWGEATVADAAGTEGYGDPYLANRDDDLGDAWADDDDDATYHPPKINLPKKVRAPEYEEEREL